jgi:predicted Zn finger-like uncharacterized protein
MASARIICPDCKAVLRPAKPVPDGKKVKCPKCGSSFTTPGLRKEEEPPRKKAPTKKASEKKDKAAVKKAPAAQAPAKKSVVDDEEDDGGIYSFVKTEEEEDKPQIEYVPDMSIKDLRGPAQEAVVKPSNYMMLIGGLSALANIFLICWSFWPMVFSESVVDWQKYLTDYYKAKQDKNAIQRIEGYKEFKDLKDQDLDLVLEANEKETKWRLMLMGGFILLLIYNAIAIVGAVKMQNLESRRWGIASSIMMLLPMGAGGLSYLAYLGIMFLEQMTGFLGEDLAMYYGIGLGVVPYLASLYAGVISLRTLLSQVVIDGFEYIAD